MSNRKTKKKTADIKNRCKTANKRKKNKIKTQHSVVHVRSSSPLCCHSSPPFVVLLVAASRGRAGAGRCFAGLCCCAFEIYYRVGLGWVSPTPTAKKNKKGRYSAFPAIPPWPPWLWRRHSQPATPPLFGGIFSKIRHAFLPWRRHGRHLISLFRIND